MTDLLLRRYSVPERVLEMDAERGAALLMFALRKEEDQLLFTRWVASGAHEVMPFEAFKASLLKRSGPEKPTEEILDDVGNILAAFEQQRGEI